MPYFKVHICTLEGTRPHAFQHQILSLEWLPITPRAQKGMQRDDFFTPLQILLIFLSQVLVV